MEITTCTMLRNYEGRDLYSETAVLGGQPITIECSHLHHTIAAAKKCRKKVIAFLREYVDDPTFSWLIIDADKRLVELRYQRGENGRTTVFKRCTPVPADMVVA